MNRFQNLSAQPLTGQMRNAECGMQNISHPHDYAQDNNKLRQERQRLTALKNGHSAFRIPHSAFPGGRGANRPQSAILKVVK